MPANFKKQVDTDLFQWLDSSDIIIPEHRIRKTIRQGYIEELAEDIRENTQLEPILVRPQGNGKFKLVAGYCRILAIKFLKYEKILATIKAVNDDKDAFFMELSENEAREDLNPIDRAEAYLNAIDRFNLSRKQLAKRIHKSEGWLSQYLKLNALPEKTKNYVREGRLQQFSALELQENESFWLVE